VRALQTLVISMLRSPDRRERAAQELSKTSLEWNFLDAVDGKLLERPIPEYLPKKVIQLLGYELMPGEIGAFLSHKKAWQACVDKNEPTLIFEDDFILLPQFEETIDYLLSQYKEWNLVRLQALQDSSFSIVHESDGVVIGKNNGDPLGCTAYLVKPEAAKKLLAGSRYIYEPIDHYIEHHSVHGLTFLAVRPYPSDISQSPTTVYRPERRPIRGWKKIKRSFDRWCDRIFSKNPWFPK